MRMHELIKISVRYVAWWRRIIITKLPAEIYQYFHYPTSTRSRNKTKGVKTFLIVQIIVSGNPKIFKVCRVTVNFSQRNELLFCYCYLRLMFFFNRRENTSWTPRGQCWTPPFFSFSSVPQLAVYITGKTFLTICEFTLFFPLHIFLLPS